MSEPNAVTYTDALPPDDKANDDDLAALLVKRQHAKPNRMTWTLLTLLVLMAGFVGGAAANAHFATTSGGTSSTLRPGAFAGGFPPGFPGAPGAAAGGTASVGGSTSVGGSATFGTVKLVDGQNLYLTTSNGETVKVKVPATAPVTAQKKVALSDIASGSTVIVRGSTAADGTVTAQSVSEGSGAVSQRTQQTQQSQGAQ